MKKINGMYEHMNTLIADDWKAEGKWEAYKLMIECMHHVSSQMKEGKEKQIADTRNRKRGTEWQKKSNNFMLFGFSTLFMIMKIMNTPSVNVI